MYRQTVCHCLTAVRGDGKVIGSGFPSWQNYLPFDWKPVMSSAWWADSSKVMKMPERHDGSQDGRSHCNAISFGTRVNVLLSILYSKTSCWDVRGKMAWENLLSEGKRESWITKASSFMYHCLVVTTSIKYSQPSLLFQPRKQFITSVLSL